MTKLIPGLLALLTCCCFYLLKNKTRYATIVWVVYSMMLMAGFYLLIDKFLFRYYHPSEWDFTSFYLWGKVAVSGHDFYQPENSQLIFHSLSLPLLNYSTFIADIVNVGFLYPPPAILYFAPLGFLSYNTALVVWTTFNMLFLVGSIGLVYDMFFKNDKLIGLILVITLFFIFSPIRSTIFYSQTNFIVLFLLLLMKKFSDNKIAGIFLALAFFTKPYMLIFILVFLINKNWKAISYCIGTSLALAGLTIILFGIQPFISYFFNNPATHRLPDSVFFEGNNQSLHAILLRANLINLHKPLAFDLMVLSLLILGSVYVYILQKRKLGDFVWAFLLLFALILYPGTLDYYGVLLLFILFQFFNPVQSFFLNPFLNILVIAIVFFLGSISVFSAFVFLLLIVMAISFARPALLNKLNQLSFMIR